MDFTHVLAYIGALSVRFLSNLSGNYFDACPCVVSGACPNSLSGSLSVRILRNLSDSCFDTCSCAVCGVCSDNLSGFLLAACDIRQSIWQIFASSGKLRRSMFCLATASKQVEIDLLSYFFRGLTFFYPGHVSKYLPGC